MVLWVGSLDWACSQPEAGRQVGQRWPHSCLAPAAISRPLPAAGWPWESSFNQPGKARWVFGPKYNLKAAEGGDWWGWFSMCIWMMFPKAQSTAGYQRQRRKQTRHLSGQRRQVGFMWSVSWLSWSRDWYSRLVSQGGEGTICTSLLVTLADHGEGTESGRDVPPVCCGEVGAPERKRYFQGVWFLPRSFLEAAWPCLAAALKTLGHFLCFWQMTDEW